MNKLLLFFLVPVSLFSQINVTFQVNMGVQIRKGLFTPGKDSLFVRIHDNAYGDSLYWKYFWFNMHNGVLGDSIYRVKADLPSMLSGKQCNYTYVLNGTQAEQSAYHPLYFHSADTVLSLVYFNNDSIYNPRKIVNLSITFTADISAIWGSGAGYFDDTRDSLMIRGLDWAGLGALIDPVSCQMKLVSPSSNGLYKTTILVKGNAGDSAYYTYFAVPSAYFFNSEHARWVTFPYSDSAIILPTAVLNIKMTPVLSKNLIIQFQADVSDPIQNGLTGELVPLNKIQFIGIKGNIPQLGSWKGNWTPSDTLVAQGSTYPTMVVMNNQGINGDAIAGDYTWTGQIVLPAGSPVTGIEFRYACMYPGADTVNGGIQPLNNESWHDGNHQYFWEEPKYSDILIDHNIFGAFPDCRCDDVREMPAVKNLHYALEQNYPNPFNPSTTISFSLSERSRVALSVYNSLGQKIAELFNGEKAAGSHSVQWNAGSFVSGVYFYELRSEKFTSVKKLLLVK